MLPPPDALALFHCPADRHPLRLDQTALRCPDCGRRYPITDGIPRLTLTAADTPPTQP